MKTDYQGPTRVDPIIIADLTIRLVRPGDPDRLLDAPDVLDLNRVDDYMPYWAYLWPGAFLLAEAVAREPISADARALEIGAGLGLTGLVALARGLFVEFTDYDAAPLAFIERSAVENRHDLGRLSTATYDWRSPEGEPFDLILGADVLYEKRLVPLVASVLEARLGPRGIGLISNPYRVAAEGFPAEIERRGLVCRTEPITAETVEFGSIRGMVYRVSRREVTGDSTAGFR